MKGSLQVAKMFGIPVKLHWSFALFILYIFYSGYSTGRDLESIGLMTVFMLALFACVVLHEYGHALTARKYGVQTRDIILSPIGGVARLERLPEKPIQEFYVAIAGPLVNLAIVILIIPLLLFLCKDEISWDSGFLRSLLNMIAFSKPLEVLPFLLLGNILLAGFNLLPAFPMDGGRIFRSLLSMKFGKLNATRIASYLGNFFGILMLIYGIYESNIITSVIGVFIFLMATQEYRMVKMETVLRGNTVVDILREGYTKIYLDSKMDFPATHVKTGVEKNFLVFDQQDNLAGVLHELFIREAIKKNDLEAPVGAYLSNRYEPISKTTLLEEVLKKMQLHGYSILPVIEEGNLVGVVDVTMMNNFLKLKR